MTKMFCDRCGKEIGFPVKAYIGGFCADLCGACKEALVRFIKHPPATDPARTCRTCGDAACPIAAGPDWSCEDWQPKEVDA